MKTLFVGQNLISLEKINSTNRYAQQLLEQNENALEGTVITAKEQVEGRGQRGNNWEAEADKNLTLSIILKPNFLSIDKQFQLNKMISLAIFDFIKLKINEQVSVKWPNDIYIGNKKVAGILIENILRQNKITQTVVGIGINVNQIIFSDENKNAISLKMLTEFDFDLDECLQLLCECVEARYFQLKANTKKIDEDYLNNLFQFNLFKNYKIGTALVYAKIKDISELGKLILENSEHQIFECDLKEIIFC